MQVLAGRREQRRAHPLGFRQQPGRLSGPGGLPGPPCGAFGQQADHDGQAGEDAQDRRVADPGEGRLPRMQRDERADQRRSRDRLDHGRNQAAGQCDRDHGQQEGERVGGRAEPTAQDGENEC